MRPHLLSLGAAVVILSGCASAPGKESTPQNPASAATPIMAPSRSTRANVDMLEQRHRERAQAYQAERNWADALVQWELLMLLRPDAAEYRDAAAATRTRIHSATGGLLRSAEFSRKQGNLEQASQLYLRVLNLDRSDATAAQALREMDIERTQRTYFNRTPRAYNQEKNSF